MLRDHVAISQEVVSYDCPKCLSGGVCFVGMFVNGFRPMSRREQRLARKAAKNLVMYKTFGRRPWNGCDPLGWVTHLSWGNERLDHLREPSGFKRMSQFADYVADPKSGYAHRNLQGRGDK